MKEYMVTSVAETQALATQLAYKIAGKQICILLNGDLGVGKTTFTKALGKALGIKKVMNSPTFTILKSYRMQDQRTLYHIDAYRLEGITQDLGFEEVFDENAICVVEWPHFIQACLPQEYISVTILYIDETKRKFQFEYSDELLRKKAWKGLEE